MIAAEKWYEYQENYQKYGFDMKPKEPRKKVKKPKPGISAKDKMRLLALTVVVGVLCIGLIVTTAFAATIKYETNNLIVLVLNSLQQRLSTRPIRLLRRIMRLKRRLKT